MNWIGKSERHERRSVCSRIPHTEPRKARNSQRIVTGKPAAFFSHSSEAGQHRAGFTTGASDGREWSAAAQRARVGREHQAAEGERAIRTGVLPAGGAQRLDVLRLALAVA